MSVEVTVEETKTDAKGAYLQVSGLEFSYGEVKVLHGLDLKIESESISCVMGRNGVGKTTFLRNLVGLERPSSGKIFIGGTEVTKHTTGPVMALAMFRRGDKFSHSLRWRRICP